MPVTKQGKNYGFFRGMVIQNNDPLRMGRIKVFIPEFSAHIARKADMEPTISEARFPGGGNIDTFLTAEVREQLKSVLPWCEQASPLIGSGTSGVCDVKNDRATVGEGYRGTPFESMGEESITPTGESVSPKAALSVNAVPGGFGMGYKTGLADTYNESLAPTGYNNAVKGMLSIPKVGSHVWVFFENGNIQHPIYFGYVFDKTDWNSVFNPQESNPDPHYPGGSENIPNDGQPFFSTGKTVLNTKAGSLEFIETDDLEKVKVSHHSGSFYEISNHITAEVCVENKTTIVNENNFETVKGKKVTTVLGDCHETYRGNHVIHYGDPDNKYLYDNWMEAAEPVFQQAALFNKKEITAEDPTTNGAAKGNSNSNYSHPTKLTLVRNWTSQLKGDAKNPSSYSKIVQHTYLGVS